MSAADGHPWFAAVYDRLNAAAERHFLGRERAHVVGGARGQVLEIGCGTGASFPYYTAAVGTLVATEPDPYMLERARRKAAEGGRAIDLRQAPAEALPLGDGACDTVVSMLVLCTVADPARVLREIRRVLRPGGELRFYEHVRHDHVLGGLAQDLVAPLWRRCFAGCNPNRATARLIRDAGFEIAELVHTTPVPPVPPLYFIRPQIRGVARRPAAA